MGSLAEARTLPDALGVQRSIQTMPVERTHRRSQLTTEHVGRGIGYVTHALAEPPRQNLPWSIDPQADERNARLAREGGDLVTIAGLP